MTEELELAPITWGWLAGFFQAEGSMYNYLPTSTHYLTITQKAKDTLISIKDFLADESITCSIYTNPAGISQLTIHSKQAEQVLSHIFPLLRGYKREQVLKWNETHYTQLMLKGKPKTSLPEAEAPIDYDFLVGFWEGDGSVAYDKNAQYLVLHFYNKDLVILESIKSFLAKGWTLVNPRDNVGQVSTYANTEDLQQLLFSLRTEQRYNQLLDMIVASDPINRRVFGESDDNNS